MPLLEVLDARLPTLGFLRREKPERHHNQAVADLALMSRSAIETADMSAALAFNGVSLKAVAILDIRTENLLVGKDADGFHIIGVKRKGTFIIKARLGYVDSM